MSATDQFLVRYTTAGSVPRLGIEIDGVLHALTSTTASPLTDLDALLASGRAADMQAMLDSHIGLPVTAADVRRHAPVQRQEVWAAGVTYKRSEQAREAESNNSNLYSRVYHATRPELFFKSLGSEVLDLGGAVGIRYDAIWSVPEPELVVVLNAHMEVIGFTIGNDMSSRDIEGENPLYLPQAKVYEGSCALGPRIWLQPGATTWPDLTIAIEVTRAGESVFHETTSTASLHRSLSELIDYLGRCKRFPRGALLFTGTGIVPPDDFTLAAGDSVRITIDPIGELVNTVRVIGGAQS